MIIDVTNIELTPSKNGKDCAGAGICCDECDYLQCCTTENPDCKNCTDEFCPKKLKRT